jgi:hypothetical protein
VEAVKFGAFEIDFGVARFGLYLLGHLRDLFVQAFVRRRRRQSRQENENQPKHFPFTIYGFYG